MSLATRLTVFSLAALAVVLAAFSAAVYILARHHLFAEADGRIAGVLDTLAAAAIDVEDHDVEWDPPDRGPPVPEAGEVRWAAFAPDGASVANSAARTPGEWAGWATSGPGGPIDRGGWRVIARRFGPAESPKPRRKSGHHAALYLVAGVKLAPIEAALNSLAWTLAGLSAAAWAAAALTGGWLCRRALAPLVRMADTAADITAETLAARLPEPGTGDELARLCAAFNGVLARLEEAFERQRRFTAEASHQLRTPLAALLGQVEVACRRERQPEEYRRVLAVVRAEAERLRQVIEALLYLARPEADAAPPTRERIDLTEWLPEQLRRWAGHARAGDLRASLPEGGGPAVATHAALLGQILDILVENALKYGDAGTPVVVKVSREAGAVLIGVEDCGWGVPEADLPLLFEPFYRSEAARRSGRPGVGLGLAVARRVARALGGSLEAASAAGVGSRFTLRLPAA